MQVKRIGYKRLYSVVGHSLDDRNGTYIELTVAGMIVHFYLGYQPPNGVTQFETPKNVIASVTQLEYEHRSAQDETEQLYLELLALRPVETELTIPDDEGDLQLEQATALLQFAQDHVSDLIAIIDTLSGMIGITSSPQLVEQQVAESIILAGDASLQAAWIIDASTEFRAINPRNITTEHLQDLLQLLGTMSQVEQSFITQASRPLGWLLRAWPEHSPLFEFMALFIPLEVIANTYPLDVNLEEKRQRAKQIQQLIKKHGGEDRDTLLQFFNGMYGRDKPSLASRFAEMAAKAAFPGWEQDIEAFERFNQLRNNLVHRGEDQPVMIVDVSTGDVRRLEELATRYIRWRLQDQIQPK